MEEVDLIDIFGLDRKKWPILAGVLMKIWVPYNTGNFVTN